MSKYLSIVVYHVSEEHIGTFLKNRGASTIQGNSWKKKSINKTGIRNLIVEGINFSHKVNAPANNVSNKTVNCLLPQVVENKDALVDYYESFFSWVSSDLSKKKHHDLNKVIIVFNFMPFAFVKSNTHRIFEGLKNVLKNANNLNNKGLDIVFLVQNSETLQDCWTFKEIASNNKEYYPRITFIDYRGFSVQGISKTRHAIERLLYSDALKLDDKKLYNKLIFQTNNYIGHYRLRGSHVRTHYDLTDFVRNNDVSEKIYKNIGEQINGYERIILIVTGLEMGALMGLASNINRYFYGHEFDYHYENVKKKHIESFQPDCILILTDIICSGETLKKSIENLKSIGIQEDAEIKITPFTIIRMGNSPESVSNLPIKSVISLKRNFYPADKNECKLCLVGQPGIDVVSVRDFKVICDQLTPYDFWELVYDCNALKKREEEKSGRVLEFRVDTKTIFSRYKHWFHNIIRNQYYKVLPHHMPDIIITVDENGGKDFADLLCDALDLDKFIICAVKRVELKKYGQMVGEKTNLKSFAGKRVLLVDDGINGGTTMVFLNDYCTAKGVDPMGAFVFDNRLNESQQKSLEHSMGKKPIMCLYRWPGKVVHVENKKNPIYA